MNGSETELNFGKLHARHAGLLIRYMVECRRESGGDLDLFLVMATIGERTFNERHAPDEMSLEAFVGGTVGKAETLPINVQSISDFTGIPRETVRRKIDILQNRGWIERDYRKYFTATDTANQDLIELTKLTEKYLRDLAIIITTQG